MGCVVGLRGIERRGIVCDVKLMIVGGDCGEWVVSVGDYGDAVVTAID